MQVESMHLVLRRRSVWEGCDIGVRLLQDAMKSVYRCHLLWALPLFAIFLSTIEIASWLPTTLIWLSKPWLDRTILFVLSRALFGTTTSVAQFWSARHEVFWSQFLETITLRRLSASRSFTQPLLQLEGLRGKARRERLRTFAARQRGVARGMTQAFVVVETALALSILSLPAWFGGPNVDLNLLNPVPRAPLYLSIAYAAAVLFVEPYYVAAGFGMYLNRRVELEAWDIEQEFRNAFAK